jgi:methylenetetrahydrofolate dehydrogenase (NADP+)/methenyltetrahydrofolate cyclohydrolase
LCRFSKNDKERITKENRVIIDIDINVIDGKLCGDVDCENIVGNVYAITPVSGDVGTVTTSVLLKHIVLSARIK